MADLHPVPAPPSHWSRWYAGGDSPERDDAFVATNNSIWGAGNWIKCYQCPRDGKLNPVFHHRLAHIDGQEAT